MTNETIKKTIDKYKNTYTILKWYIIIFGIITIFTKMGLIILFIIALISGLIYDYLNNKKGGA